MKNNNGSSRRIKYGIESAYVDSKLDLKSRTEAITRFQEGSIEMLCNYDVLTAGFDAPNGDCILVGRPIRSILLYTQMVGRGMRRTKSGGTKDMLLSILTTTFRHMTTRRWKRAGRYSGNAGRSGERLGASPL